MVHVIKLDSTKEWPVFYSALITHWLLKSKSIIKQHLNGEHVNLNHYQSYIKWNNKKDLMIGWIKCTAFCLSCVPSCRTRTRWKQTNCKQHDEFKSFISIATKPIKILYFVDSLRFTVISVTRDIRLTIATFEWSF